MLMDDVRRHGVDFEISKPSDLFRTTRREDGQEAYGKHDREKRRVKCKAMFEGSLPTRPERSDPSSAVPR